LLALVLEEWGNSIRIERVAVTLSKRVKVEVQASAESLEEALVLILESMAPGDEKSVRIRLGS
jgi:hypothetical protein